MGLVLSMVTLSIGVLCGARVTLTGFVVVLAGVLGLTATLGIFADLEFWAIMLYLLTALVSLQLGYLGGAVALSRARFGFGARDVQGKGSEDAPHLGKDGVKLEK